MKLQKKITCPVCQKELPNLKLGTLEIQYASKAKGIKGEIRAVHSALCAGKLPASENFPLVRLEESPLGVGEKLLKLIDDFYLPQMAADAFMKSLYEDFRPSSFWEEVRGRRKDDKERW